jgi:hypothetical protein
LHHSVAAELVDRRKSGATIDLLVDAFGVHLTTVISIVRRAGRS